MLMQSAVRQLTDNTVFTSTVNDFLIDDQCRGQPCTVDKPMIWEEKDPTCILKPSFNSGD